MTEPILREGSLTWRKELVDFVEKLRETLPQQDELTPLQDWQRRITGGVVVQFFSFLEKTASEELYPQLADHPLPERLFLLVTDEAGLLAAQELMDLDSVQAYAVLKEEWRAFLEAPNTDPDEAYVHHYQFWSVWHQNIPDNWDVEPLEEGYDYWLHEEGFALADGAGRGAQHLWKWNGEKMELAEETMTSWTS